MRITSLTPLIFVFCAAPSAWAYSGARSSHSIGFNVTAGAPELISGQLVITSVPNFEFGAGAGGFPINALLRSMYTFSAIPVDLQTGDTYNLYPSASYALSSLHAFVRWYPADSGFFLHFEASSVAFSASLSGNLKDETLGTSVPGALAGSVTLNQPMIQLGPGYQILVGDHFHLDFSAGVAMLLPASSSVNIGGSLSSLAALNATAQANYDAAKQNAANSINQAMAVYQSSVKALPTLFLSLGYLF